MKSCSICNKPFEPKYTTMQKVCSIDCARDMARLERENEFRKETRKRKKKLNSEDRSYQLRKTQQTFNEYIRLRDDISGCISCKRQHQGQYHAGHYRTVKSQSSLRFHEMNCHKQCAPCNNHLSGNITEYRINLEKKIGKENLEWLETDHAPYKFTIEEIKEIREYYKGKIKWLKNQKNS